LANQLSSIETAVSAWLAPGKVQGEGDKQREWFDRKISMNLAKHGQVQYTANPPVL
jgi:hypothetical protein